MDSTNKVVNYLGKTRRLLKKLGQSGKYKFRPRRYGVDDKVYCLQMTPINKWLLTYMKDGEIVSEIYFVDFPRASLYICRQSLKYFKKEKGVNAGKQISKVNDEVNKYERKIRSLYGISESGEWNIGTSPWWKDDIVDYTEYNKQIRYCIQFLKTIGELKNFQVVPDNAGKDQNTIILCDIYYFLYVSKFLERGMSIPGKSFYTFQEAFLYLRLQALTVFYNRQKNFIRQWKRDLEEDKTIVDFLFRTDWTVRPERIGRFTKTCLLTFLGNIKYGNNNFLPDSSNGERYIWNNKNFLNNEVCLQERVKHFRLKISALNYLFCKEYGEKIQELITRFENKRKVWLWIYEQELDRFVAFYQKQFEKEYKEISVQQINRPEIGKRHLAAPMWKPEEMIMDFFDPYEIVRERYTFEEEEVLIERYGNLYGSFVSLYGTPFEKLSLPPAHKAGEYHILKVKSPIQAGSYIIAPAFRQPGGGRGFILCEPISELLRKGALELIR